NLSGVKNIGSVQVVTTVIKFAVLAFISTVGLFFISSANFTPWNVSGESAINAIGGGMAIALFSYLGVETAAVAAAKVRDPDRNVPRATVLGTIATAIVYVLSLIAVFGMLPTSTLANATAPFSDAANVIFGGTWAGNVMAVAVIISGLGALNGGTLICAEMPRAAAKDGPFPKQFERICRKSPPAYGIIASTVLASLAMAINYLGSGGATVFTTLVLMTGITSAIPYGFSALAQLKWRWIDHQQMHTPRFARDMIVAVLALVFSILFIVYSRNTGQSFWVYWAPYFLAAGALLLGIPVYIAQRSRLTQPGPVPAYRSPVRPCEEAENADRDRAGRQRAAAAVRRDDHRSPAAERQGRGRGDCPAGRRAQHRDCARQRAAGGPAVPAGRVVHRRRAVPAGRPGRGHPGHDRLPDPAGTAGPPATRPPGGDPAHDDRGGPERPGVRHPDEVRWPRLRQGRRRRAGRGKGLGVPPRR